MDLSLVSIDSTTARAHHDAAGMHVDDTLSDWTQQTGVSRGGEARQGVSAARHWARRSTQAWQRQSARTPAALAERGPVLG
ncbi:hypothetical protein [Streptomyces sp. NPDC001621]|uniref:hypothetical protein n=1 Tax=Streptomyces sp. NPDC001621 TaxID=3364594 RepID=UPI0036A1609E